MPEKNNLIENSRALERGLQREHAERFTWGCSDGHAIGYMSMLIVGMVSDEPSHVEYARERVKELIAKGNAA